MALTARWGSCKSLPHLAAKPGSAKGPCQLGTAVRAVWRQIVQSSALVTLIGAIVRGLVRNIEEQSSSPVFVANYSMTSVHDLTSGASTMSSVKRG